MNYIKTSLVFIEIVSLFQCVINQEMQDLNFFVRSLI